MKRWTLLSSLLLACGPAIATPASEGETTSAESPASSTGVEDPSSTSGPSATVGSSSATEHGSSGGSGSSGSTTGCVDEGPTLVPDPDDPETRCLYDEVDCGCGYRCTTYGDPDLDYNPWRHNGCFPIDPNPVGLGDPCESQEHPWSGLDNCPAGAQCQDWDQDGLGTCKEFCDETDPDYECSQPDAVPYVGCQECGCVCEIGCDPRENECGEGQGCYLASSLGQCAPDASEELGAFGDPCEFVNACDPGLACVNSAAVPDCQGATGCCTPHCDVESPECPEGTQCTQIWEPGEEPAPLLEGLGYCLDPDAV